MAAAARGGSTPGDVRMRGFAERADVEEVERFLATLTAEPLPPEAVPVTVCAGRVLAVDVTAPVDVPGFARAAMDGYAVRGEDTFGASAYEPRTLELLGTSLPGRPFGGCVAAGQAVRIMTGAPLPDGADAVVMAEACEEVGSEVRVQEPVAPRKHVGARGEDVRSGDPVLASGRRLRAQDAAVLASLGVDPVLCVRAARVALVITGDELLPPGSRPEGPKIVDSNSVLLAALVARDGGRLLPHSILPDAPDAILAAMRNPEADLVLVSGGSSVGQEDHAPRLVEAHGSLDYHGVSMRPSSPAGVGRLDGRLVFLLPGNPVSCLCAYEFFAGPSLRALAGLPREWPHRRARLPLRRKIVSAVGRTDYVRVGIERGRVVPIATSGASILSSTVRAAGCVIVPRELEGMPEGSEVEVLLYDDVLPSQGAG